MRVESDLVEKAYNFIKDVIEKFGPRYSSSSAEHKANKWVKDEVFSKYCDDVFIEEFKTHPDLYPQGIFKLVFIFGTLALIFVPFSKGITLVSTGLILYAVGTLYAELFKLKRWAEFLFKKGVSTNTIGILKPTGEVKKRVVIEGHIDSAKQMRIAEKEHLSLMPLILGVLYLIWTILMPVANFAYPYSEGLTTRIDFVCCNGWIHLTLISIIYYIGAAVLYPCFVYLIYQLTGDKVVPGASDNLSGIAVCVAVADYFSRNKLKNVELIIGSMGSEEIGDQGAKYFVSRHGDLLKDAYILVLEEMGTGNIFNIITKDFHVKKPYPEEVIRFIEKAYERYKINNPDVFPIQRKKIPFGSSDACMYHNAGYKVGFLVTAHVSEDTTKDEKKLQKPKNWHSMRDTWQNISKTTLKHAIGITIEFIKFISEECSK
ncbi:MAG: M28 family peptidase [Promethearchaeota archaeon]